MPKVSVILPNYNHSQFLSQRIESILNQTFQDFELIILDDCSPDNSKQIIETYRDHPRVSQIVYNTQNSGSTFKQWGKGINLAKGEYIWLAESDDYCEPTFLSELVPKLDEYPDVGIAYCQSRSVDQDAHLLKSWIEHTNIFTPNIWQDNFLIEGSSAITNFFVYRNIIPNASGVLFRKSRYKATSGIDTMMTLNGDWLLWIKLLENSSLLFIAKELNYFRQHNNKATGTNTRNFNNLKEIFEVLKYINKQFDLPNEIIKKMTNIIVCIWISQIQHSNICKGFINSFKVAKSAFAFNKTFYLNFTIVVINLVINRLTGRENKNVLKENSISSISQNFLQHTLY